jgi:predicted RNase H-like nuclease (RuvC/YqgF family)
LPEDEQRAAAIAGDDELKQAAKRVREAKRKPKKETEAGEGEDLPTLRRRVAELTAEVAELKADNDALREQLARWERSASE